MNRPARSPRRLDAYHVPDPIRAMEEDARKAGTHATGELGTVPPLSTTEFASRDGGFASPRLLRASLYAIPATRRTLEDAGLPLALSLCPFAREAPGETPPPLVDAGARGPVRCNRCEAYVSPFVRFTDKFFSCAFCKASTEVPAEYFSRLHRIGESIDKDRHPELHLGAYEILATKKYCKASPPPIHVDLRSTSTRDHTSLVSPPQNGKFPEEPAFVFVLDASQNCTAPVSLFCSKVKSLLKCLPKEAGAGPAEASRVRVGFITYHKSVDFYNCKASPGAAGKIPANDDGGMYNFLTDGFLVDPTESESTIDQILNDISKCKAKDNRSTETILARAIQFGTEALAVGTDSIGDGSRDDGLSMTCRWGFPGQRVLREAVRVPRCCCSDAGVGEGEELRALRDGDLECGVAHGGHGPQIPKLSGVFELGVEAVECDLSMSSMGDLQVATDGRRFLLDLGGAVGRPVAFDCEVQIRTSKGVRPVRVVGQSPMANANAVKLAAIDSDKGFCVELEHEGKLEEEAVYLQVAVLYTTCGGQRRLRILNLACGVAAGMAEVYRSAELDTIITYLTKAAIEEFPERNLQKTRQDLVDHCARILASYTRTFGGPAYAGQVILPENGLKLLPLYMYCLSRSPMLKEGRNLPDRMASSSPRHQLMVLTMDVPSTMAYLYPRLLPLGDASDGEPDGPGEPGGPGEPLRLPKRVPCLVQKFQEEGDDDGIYLLENGISMYLWVGPGADSDRLLDVFGARSPAETKMELEAGENGEKPLSHRIHAIIDAVQSQRPHQMPLTVVRKEDGMGKAVRDLLVEDQALSPSQYCKFLNDVRSEVRRLA
ncbi:unnamed protein product [Darwinula stevensoni]|uniref:Uncharacterized protein n=1 Tax=Darwinula stevensoni TaxID=69355 RepID=A0A7R9A8N1_9CRUS|nr:unnamed protein product [Darwinula stevensoni]CAG0896537.1 unnamed protein product [Darwinula stevensoni]